MNIPTIDLDFDNYILAQILKLHQWTEVKYLIAFLISQSEN